MISICAKPMIDIKAKLKYIDELTGNSEITNEVVSLLFSESRIQAAIKEIKSQHVNPKEWSDWAKKCGAIPVDFND